MKAYLTKLIKMKQRIGASIKKFLSITASRTTSPSQISIGVDVREEYANAFRTESYVEFWARVLALSKGDSALAIPIESTTAARLPSYRLFAEHLLDPDQPTVTRVLALTHNPPKINCALSEYFAKTADASLLCGALLKDVDHIRGKCRALNTIFGSLATTPFSPEKHTSTILTGLSEFANSINPFGWSAQSPSQVRTAQEDCSKLLKGLELSRKKALAKLQLKLKLKHCSAIILVALTATLTIVIAIHALAILVATPSLITATLELASMRSLARTSAQLDAAAKGTYIVSKDLETISRLVARLNDGLEHIQCTIKFWLERGQEWFQANCEVARQLNKNECCFIEQLDELEEHLYMCFMTINRARNLVVKEILDPGQASRDTNILSQL